MNLKTIFAASALSLAALSAGLIGCGNACDDAVSHYESCASTSTSTSTSTSSASVDCTGVTECQAEAINNASCDALTGKDATAAAAYAKAVAACSTSSS